MKRDLVKTGVELERELDLDLKRWARADERSKRVQVRRIIRCVIQVWKRDPNSEALRALGLIQSEPLADAAGMHRHA